MDADAHKIMKAKVKKFEELDTKIKNLQNNINSLNDTGHIPYFAISFVDSPRVDTFTLQTYEEENAQFKMVLQKEILEFVKGKFNDEMKRLKDEIDNI